VGEGTAGRVAESCDEVADQGAAQVERQGVTHPYGGLLGILGGAGAVFFAFIGFDAVSTAAQEAKNAKRDIPIGILGSLSICTLLYVLFSHMLSGVATIQDFRTEGREASVAYAIKTYMTGYSWMANCVTIAILAGFSSGILVMLLGQSRVFYSMSKDGLVPRIFSDVHPRFRTPWKSNILFFVFTALFAAVCSSRHRGRHDERWNSVRFYPRMCGRFDLPRSTS
jgi:APA family basic amino acid/polyamine antiporter